MVDGAAHDENKYIWIKGHVDESESVVYIFLFDNDLFFSE